MQAGGASEQDPDRVLPGFESTRELSGDEFRLPELYVSPTTGAGPTRSLLRELQSGGEPGAAKRIRQEMRRSWRLPRRTDKALTDLAHMFNPVIRGWIGYFGRYHKSALYPVFQHLNLTLS